MAKIIRITATDGTPIEFVDEMKTQGGMKDIYFSPDRSYVVGFFRDKQDATAKERLTMISGTYREKIFNQIGGEYWKNLFCFPTHVVEYNGRLGGRHAIFQTSFFLSVWV